MVQHDILTSSCVIIFFPHTYSNELRPSPNHCLLSLVRLINDFSIVQSQTCARKSDQSSQIKGGIFVCHPLLPLFACVEYDVARGLMRARCNDVRVRLVKRSLAGKMLSLRTGFVEYEKLTPSGSIRLNRERCQSVYSTRVQTPTKNVCGE